jgi:copper chaperone CopZ
MRKGALFTAAAMLLWAVTGRAEDVQLRVTGSHCPGCGSKIAEALGKVPSAKVKGKGIGKGSGKDDGVKVTVTIDLAKSDVGDLAKAVAGADTYHRTLGAPTASLIVKTTSLTEDSAKNLKQALVNVNGVIAAASTANPKLNEIAVRLDDRGGAKLAEIQKALADYTKKK